MTSNLTQYLRASTANSSKISSFTDVMNLVRFYPRWSASLTNGANALDDTQPWITFAAAEFLVNFMSQRAGTRVFEFGSGGSTLFFLEHGAQVCTVEHDESWFRAVSNRISPALIPNWRGQLCRPKRTAPLRDQAAVSDPSSYESSSSEYSGMRFDTYSQSIDCYPDHYFDLVLIDGRSRPSCWHHAKDKVRSGGLLVLDNSEREHYSVIHSSMKKSGAWEETLFSGPGPYNHYFWETTIWKRLGI